jgi:hypothetical protein
MDGLDRGQRRSLRQELEAKHPSQMLRRLPFDRKVEVLILEHSDVALIVRPMLVAWRQVRKRPLRAVGKRVLQCPEFNLLAETFINA